MVHLCKASVIAAWNSVQRLDDKFAMDCKVFHQSWSRAPQVLELMKDGMEIGDPTKLFSNL